MIEVVVKAVVQFLGVAALIALMVPLGALIGAFTGSVIGLFFPVTIGALAERLLWVGAAPWQLGASLGFVSGFFSRSKAAGES